MPYKMKYAGKSVKKGGSRTPKSVMGGQGKPAKIPSTSTSKKTKRTKFPG